MAFLKHHKMVTELNKYISYCGKFRDGTPQDYSIYCYGFVTPTLQKRRDKDMMVWGKYFSVLTIE